MAQAPPVVTREAGTSTPAGRPARRRLSASHLLVAVAVVLAFVLNILALQDRSASISVAVAREPLPAGTVLDLESIEMSAVPANFGGVDSLLVEDLIPGMRGWVLLRSIPEGGVIDLASLAAPGAGPGFRSMSIPVDPAHAAGGTIGLGDRIDVITVSDGTASFIVSDVEVVAVPPEANGAFSSPGSNHLVVAVTAEEALALAEAIDSGSIEVIRATGADGTSSRP